MLVEATLGSAASGQLVRHLGTVRRPFTVRRRADSRRARRERWRRHFRRRWHRWCSVGSPKLPPDVARLVVTGAAFGQEFQLAIAAAVADLGDEDSLDAAEGALGAQLLHEVPGRVDWYRFSHQLVPAAALESISGSRRVRLHARVAEELERRGASGIEIAHHLIEASPGARCTDVVVGRIRDVSDAAMRMHQYDRAVELLERVSQLDVDERLRAELLCEFGAACNLAGQQPRALDGLTRAAEAARRNGWDDLLAAAALGMWGQSPFRASQDRTVIPLLDEAIGRSDQARRSVQGSTPRQTRRIQSLQRPHGRA